MSATEAYEEREGSEITEYDEFSVEYRDASHMYWLHHEGRRLKVPSVTTILGVLNKPALLGWYEAKGAEGAARLAEMGELDLVAPETAVEIVRLHRMGAEARRDDGASRGTLIHQMQEAYVATGLPPKLGDFEPQHRGFVQAYCRWLLQANPEPLECEKRVGSLRHGYAGTLDMLARVTHEGRRLLAILDAKTSRGGHPWPEHPLQLLGYAAAYEECTGGTVDELLVLPLAEDGSEPRPLRVVGSTLDFLNVLNTWRTWRRMQALVKDHRDAA